MKMHRDILTQTTLRLKLYWKDKATVTVFLLVCFCFLFCVFDLNQNAEEKAALQVGIVNLDEGTEGQKLMERLDRVPALLVQTGTWEELEQSMMDGYLRCILEIHPDFSKKLEKGSCKRVITVYHEEGDNVSAVISDIVAGEIMYELCLSRAYRTYEKLPEYERQKYTREEYADYTASLLDREEFDFAFEFEFTDTTGKTEKQGLDNSLFYRQAVAAAACMLMTLLQFTAMSGVMLEKEQGLHTRSKLICISFGAGMAGNLLAAAILSMLCSTIFAAAVSFGVQDGKVFFSLLWISVIFSVMMALVYYALTVLAQNLLSYQISGAVLLLLTGVSGFCSMVEGVLIGNFPAWFDWIPNVIYLRWFTEIIGRV